MLWRSCEIEFDSLNGARVGNCASRRRSRPEVALPQTSPKPPRPAPPRLDQFPSRVPDIIRFGDMDRQGHVNNAVFSTYLETGRVGIIYREGDGLQVAGATTVMARLEIDFLKELRWPGTVEVGTAVAEIGRRSYTLVQAVFHEGACAALARATMVLIDRETRRSQALPPELLERLQRWMLRNEA
jgi:acyl-CoA thioester hydrolase